VLPKVLAGQQSVQARVQQGRREAFPPPRASAGPVCEMDVLGVDPLRVVEQLAALPA
jgi:hypothetical protein